VALRLDSGVTLRPLSVTDLDHMIERGILGEADRVELLDGALVEMSPQSPDHAAVLRALLSWVAGPATEQGLYLSAQAPLEIGQPLTRPEPDLALVPRPPAGHHASAALLVVEVSISSRAVDLGAKAAFYAQAGVPDYWVIDVASREVAVHREPVSDRFRLVRRLAEGDVVEALALALRVDVAALFADVERT
jgi:Uma2 family endonuclease